MSPQADLTRLVSQLRIKVLPRHRNLKTPEGPVGRIHRIRKTVTALVRHERIEVTYHLADESRGYAERLISEALRYGDLHRPTLKLATFWLEDAALVPKLFKVLVPRYEKWPLGLPYTRMLRAPSSVIDHMDNQRMKYPVALLELRGNPYPSLSGPKTKPNPGLLHNVLLEAARKSYYASESKISQDVEREVHTLPLEDSSKLEDVTSDDIQDLAETLEQPVSSIQKDIEEIKDKEETKP